MALDRSPGVVGALLMPLRLPGRVVADIETMAVAVVSLQGIARKHLGSVDTGVTELISAVGRLQASIAHIDAEVQGLMGIEAAVNEDMCRVREDINTRMTALEAEVHEIRAPLDQIARDLKQLQRLLPNPSDGPWARLRDTLTSS